MTNSQNCRCPHHIVMKILMVLAWASGVLFFWASLGDRLFWGFNASYWAWVVVVLVLLSKSTKGVCKCCCGDKHCDTCPVK